MAFSDSPDNEFVIWGLDMLMDLIRVGFWLEIDISYIGTLLVSRWEFKMVKSWLYVRI